MNVLVVGAGLVGSQIARQLIDERWTVVLFDRTPQLDALEEIVPAESAPLFRGDILNPFDLARAIREHQVDAIVHTAANPMLTVGAQQSPVSAVETNVIGSLNILEVARTFELKRVVLMSSSVLAHQLDGGEDAGDVAREEAFPRPATFYAATKQALEGLAHNYARSFNLDVVTLRPAAVFGPWSGNGGGGPTALFRDLVTKCVLREPAVLPPAEFEWVYSKDVAFATKLALQARQLAHRTFNISSGHVFRSTEAAELAMQLFPGAQITVEQA